MKGPTLDAKLAPMGLNGLASSVRQLFVEAGTDSGESCIVLSFHSVQSSLAVHEFDAAGEERCKRGHGWVCANL